MFGRAVIAVPLAIGACYLLNDTCSAGVKWAGQHGAKAAFEWMVQRGIEQSLKAAK
jgi:hypothetical protein